MSATFIPVTADFSNISVTGSATWTATDTINIAADGALNLSAGTTAAFVGEDSINFATTSYGFLITESTGVIAQTGRIQKNIVSAADDATAAIDCAITDIYELTAMANATTFSVTGTPLNGQALLVRLKDNGTARALTWGSEFASKGATLPTTTVLGKQHYVGFVYNSASSKWECIMATVEA